MPLQISGLVKRSIHSRSHSTVPKQIAGEETNLNSGSNVSLPDMPNFNIHACDVVIAGAGPAGLMLASVFTVPISRHPQLTSA